MRTGAKTLLIRNADIVVTMDDARREIRDGALLIRGGIIERVGVSADLPAEADRIIDARGHILLPGLVNTHHHMYQTLTRAVPDAQDAELFGWLKALYPLWARLTPEMAYVSALTAMAELILSGCTTASDHLYVYPNGVRLDDTIQAAQEIGMRFHACRGAMSLGQSNGGLPPDQLCENEPSILADMRRVVETWHDSTHNAMVRIALAPCSPFSVTLDLMRETAALARSYGVRLHTHLAENSADLAFSRERFGATPAEYVERLGWIGTDVWHAHCVHLDDAGIALFARTGTGIAHCPSSNMRLASGIAPLRKMLGAGVPIGLGVDGSASNDAGHLLAEARIAMLSARARDADPAALTARQALELATRGGARVLGRDDIGELTPGFAADVIGYRSDDLSLAGALHDPVAALVFCTPARVALSVIAGRVIVNGGELTTVDTIRLTERHNRLARRLLGGD